MTVIEGTAGYQVRITIIKADFMMTTPADCCQYQGCLFVCFPALSN